MSDLKINYVEFASPDIAASKQFFTTAFGWGFDDYGPEYQGFADAGIDGGIDGTSDGPARAPLIILKADDLEGSLKRVEAAGGIVTKPIFSFPGGRRFHFREPGGNELAVWSENEGGSSS